MRFPGHETVSIGNRVRVNVASETVGDIICRSCGNHLVGNSFGKCIKEVIFCLQAQVNGPMQLRRL